MKYNFADCIGLRLRRLSSVADGYLRKCISESGVTENQMTILFVLNGSGKLEQGKIGEFLNLERSTISRNIKLLHQKNLVIKTANYRPEIELSKEGEQLVIKLIPLWEKAMDALMDIIEAEGLKSLESLEKRMT